MSIGQLKTPIEIYETGIVTDDEGFAVKVDRLILKAKAYREVRHGSESWKNRASFSTATTLIRIRRNPIIKVTSEHFILIDDEHYNIISVDDIKDNGMYLEILAQRTSSSKG